VEEVPLQLGTVVGSDLVRVVLLLLNNDQVVEYLVALEVKVLVVVVVVVLRNVDPVEVVVLTVYRSDWRVVVVVIGLVLCLVLCLVLLVGA